MSATPLFPPYLNQGSKGPAVNMLAFMLKTIFAVSNKDKILYDGGYTSGGEIAKGVEEVQNNLGFRGSDIDGNFGPKTREALKTRYRIDVDKLTVEMFQGETVAVGP